MSPKSWKKFDDAALELEVGKPCNVTAAGRLYKVRERDDVLNGL